MEGFTVKILVVQILQTVVTWPSSCICTLLGTVDFTFFVKFWELDLFWIFLQTNWQRVGACSIIWPKVLHQHFKSQHQRISKPGCNNILYGFQKIKNFYTILHELPCARPILKIAKFWKPNWFAQQFWSIILRLWQIMIIAKGGVHAIARNNFIFGWNWKFQWNLSKISFTHNCRCFHLLC